MLQVIFKVTLLGLRDQVWHDMVPWPTRSGQLGKLTKNKSAPCIGNGVRTERRPGPPLCSTVAGDDVHGKLQPGSANVGLPRRNAPEALMLRPPHHPGAVVQGKDSLTTLFQSSASLWILTPNGASIVTGNVAANLGSLDRHPRVRQIASGTSNPWQSSPVSQRNAATHHRQFTGTAREKKSRSCSMEKCHSSGL